MSKRNDILESVRKVPSLPVTTARVLALVQNPHTSVAALQQEVELNPGLASNILRLANSAYFRGAHPIASVRDALVRLGMKRVAQLVLTTSVEPLTRPAVSGYGLQSGGLFRHSAATAMAAEQLAGVLGMEPPDHLYTAGLLHDLGKIVMGTFLEIDAEPILKLAFDEGLSFERAERRILGVDHAEVGATLLATWEIPSSVVDVVRWHHEPEQFPGDDKTVVDVVHVADHMSRLSGTSAEADGLNYELSAASVERLGITPAITERVIDEVLRTLDEICTSARD
ncbi:MAG: hypothetical protein AMXMBFR82_01130 [Candidatus Hydrogenedentota bacterium]